MGYTARRVCSAFASALPGWIFLCVGLTIAAAAVLAPAWEAVRETKWRRDVMARQADQLVAQKARYEQFLDALSADDPNLLEQLAFTQLRMKPVGRELLDAGLMPSERNTAALVLHRDEPGPHMPAAFPAIDQWLRVPVPQAGRDIAPMPPVRTRLSRMTRGYSRIPLAAAGLAAVLAGCVWSLPTRRRS